MNNLKKESAAALSYVLGPLTGILFLIVSPLPLVQFHAMQSVVFFVAVVVVNTVFTVSGVLAFLVPVLVLGEFALWLVMIYQASQGKMWGVPVLKKIVVKLLGQI